VKKALLDLVINDIYWSVITPSQAVLMLYGLPPPDIKNTFKDMKKIFVNKEKMLEQKYIKILEEITIKYYKGYEHEKVKEVTGREVDKLLKNTEDYLKRLKELREQIEKHAQKKTIDQVYKDTFDLLKIVTKKKSQKEMVDVFSNSLVKGGKFTKQNLRDLEKVIEAKDLSKKNKLTLQKADEARKSSVSLINDLIEYNQRCDLVSFEKGRMMLKYGKGQLAELVNAAGKSFLVQGSVIKKLGKRIEISNMEEISKALKEQKETKNVVVDPKVFGQIQKELGDFEVVI
jgi:uncharacterized protein (UPF0332 family)